MCPWDASRVKKPAEVSGPPRDRLARLTLDSRGDETPVDVFSPPVFDEDFTATICYIRAISRPH